MFSSAANASGVPVAALRASRFLKPPGRFKRAEMREHPRRGGPWDGLVRAAVRRREKARQFDVLPPPRLVPEPLPSSAPSLAAVRGVPSVSAEALHLRLQFLLGPKAPAQQQRAKLRPGLTPYQAELFTWERQMREVRRIYRAQFLQRLAEVTDEEAAKQQALQAQIREDRRIRREETLQRVYDDKRRRAVLKDRLQIERKERSALLALGKRKVRRSRRGEGRGRGRRRREWAGGSASVATSSRRGQTTGASLRGEEKRLSAAGAEPSGEILEESFKLLPEDAPSLHPEGGEEDRKAAASVLSEEQRAEVTYAHFTDEEKLQLLDEKLEQLNKKIDADSQLRGGTKDVLLLQLRDHLQAAKEAYIERSYLKETEDRLRQQPELQKDGADDNRGKSSSR